MGTGGQVVGSRPVPEMGVDHDPEPLEIVEVPVDRRDVHLGRERLDLGTQLLRGAMAFGIEQGPKQQHPRARDPSTSFSEQRQRTLDRIDGGRRRGSL
jgi:hypothetical protein